MVLQFLKIALRLRDWHLFMTVTRNFESFVTDPNIAFLNDKKFFQKWEYHFLVKSTKIYVVPVSL